MVCLFHSDYGPADPAFKLDPGSTVGVRGWIVGASSFKEARNIGEVEAIQRQLLAETLAPVGPQGPPARRSARLVTVAARARGSLLWTTGTSCDCACNRRSFKKETACHSRAPSRQSSGTKHLRREDESRYSSSLNCAARHLTAAGTPSLATSSRNFVPNSVLVA